MKQLIKELDIKNNVFALMFLMTLAVFASCTRSPDPNPIKAVLKSPSPVTVSQGEVAIPTIEGNLIKVNNKLCAVSRGPMDEKTLGTFKGQVAYEGTNPKYQGKTFEFNYCCGMCQKSFPDKFKQDPDGILRFHGLL